MAAGGGGGGAVWKAGRHGAVVVAAAMLRSKGEWCCRTMAPVWYKNNRLARILADLRNTSVGARCKMRKCVHARFLSCPTPAAAFEGHREQSLRPRRHFSSLEQTYHETPACCPWRLLAKGDNSCGRS